ncbi:competence type IV pilus major pilin ComGC [Lentilactobacillus sp. Marseille-Q4993]|uniref:competence type IV pilus major pilin ComGC n=1 Tax=Lentilactobacillus sp. Marseille-Q4993 TaxID=3039492 RepID=UPI0024BD2084|nr:competence type IV pilus major pilin ComGC [Lentilactobacillus sp. Marseille-Q4993]
MKKILKKESEAFTLIEMTIVLFIISLLILIIIPNLSNQRNHARSVHSNAMISVVQSQVDSFVNLHPDVHNVTFADLTKDGYLTSKQVSEAKEEGLKIVRNEVEK